jgi:phosphoribosylglycinamide formyltransferase-1
MGVSLAILASGSGTNAENIARYFKNQGNIEVRLILSNKADAGVLDRAGRLGIPSRVFSREQFQNPDFMLPMLRKAEADLLILAGFLWLIPSFLVESYPDRIINIHPALLPAYGGKGMYGDHVHRAVIGAKEKKSGITVHYVNEKYDEGAIIEQFECSIEPDDSPDSLAEKIHALEYKHFPEVIETVAKQLQNAD